MGLEDRRIAVQYIKVRDMSLSNEDNVYNTQNEWKSFGKFILVHKDHLEDELELGVS